MTKETKNVGVKVRPKLPRVRSLRELRELAASSERYKALAIASARNLGGPIKDGDVEAAHRWLATNAAETDESGVVGEVNFCRDLV